MTAERLDGAATSNPALLYSDDAKSSELAIGDRILGPGQGIIVDIDGDAIVVARRNARGRCMELVFVGDAVRMLRRA